MRNHILRQVTSPIFVLIMATAAFAQTDANAKTNGDEISFRKRAGEMDIVIDGKRFATYVWSDPQTTRPYFKQLHAVGGEVQITRNHPPHPDDFGDHATYHPGLWWGFGDVGGNDYWRMKAKIIGGSFIEEPASGAPGELCRAQPLARQR